MKNLALFFAAVLLSAGLFAQQPPQNGERPAPPKMKTPEEIAQMQASLMREEVGLSDKQYKKVYKLIKKDHEYRQSQAQNQFGGGMPPMGGGGPDGMGGGMPPQGFGGPGGGSMGGGPMGGGMPPMGEMGQRPQGPPPGMESIVTDEYLEKQDVKLRKILTEEQYSKWRSKHPAEHLALPEVELK